MFTELSPLTLSIHNLHPHKVYVCALSPKLGDHASVEHAITIAIGNSVFEQLRWQPQHPIAALWGEERNKGKLRLTEAYYPRPGWNIYQTNSGHSEVSISRLPADVLPPMESHLAVDHKIGTYPDGRQKLLTIQLPASMLYPRKKAAA